MKKVVFAASEAVPFIKTGGLADVTGSLAAALEKEGYHIYVFLPKYACLAESYRHSLQYCGHFWMDFDSRDVYVGIFVYHGEDYDTYFIDNEEFFKTDTVYTSNHYYEVKRFAYFSKAVLASLKFLQIPADIIHCHDWQTALIPLYLKKYFMYDSYYWPMKTVFTIHNLRFQGKWNKEEFSRLSGIHPDFLWGDESNMLANGVVYSDALNTVSPSYAQEIQGAYYGEGLDSLLRQQQHKLHGILNGIDTKNFDPTKDPWIKQPFTTENFRQQRVKNKRSLQKERGLPTDKRIFLVGMVSRLTDQKGLDLLAYILEEMLVNDDMQFVILGSGDPRYEEMLRYFCAKYPQKLAVYIGYNDQLAHQIYAGCDAFLMPSLFEPCGLSQMIAMHYGCLPVVRETGGLKDSVEAYNRYQETGTGFSFRNYNAHEMMACLRYGHEIYSQHKASWNKMMLRAMKCDFSWKHSAQLYRKLYEEIGEN